MKKYKEIEGTSFDSETPLQVCFILNEYMNKSPRKRLILDYGDSITGQSWGEVNDIRGTIGRSTGTVKIPLLIKTSRSYGGGAILDNCIVKITDSETKKVIYQHEKYTPYENINKS